MKACCIRRLIAYAKKLSILLEFARVRRSSKTTNNKKGGSELRQVSFEKPEVLFPRFNFAFNQVGVAKFLLSFSSLLFSPGSTGAVPLQGAPKRTAIIQSHSLRSARWQRSDRQWSETLPTAGRSLEHWHQLCTCELSSHLAWTAGRHTPKTVPFPIRPIRPVSIGGFASARCVALHCGVYLQDAQLTLLKCKCSNQVFTFMWMYVCPVLQRLYKNVMIYLYIYIYIFMIVDVLFNAYTSRYVAVGNTEIRNTQAFWETTELSTTTTSFVCTVFFKVWIGKVPLKWRLICLFTSYPKHKSAIRIPRMKRLTGTHHYTALVLLALLQGSLFARKPSLMRCFRMPFHILEVMMSLFDESRNDERFLFFCDMFNMFYLLSM